MAFLYRSLRGGALSVVPLSFSSFLFSMAPGLADRHCFPAQDAYFAARYLLQEGGEKCEPALDAARDELDAAIDQAGICGCTDLIANLEQLRRIAGNHKQSCEDRSEALLDAKAQIEGTVRDCHY